MASQTITKIKVEDLCLWTENPRDPMNLDDSDYDIIKKAIHNDKAKWNLPKLVDEMGKHYDFSELPTVVKTEGKFIIYDGNRRIAVLKYLQNQKLYAELGGGLFFKNEPKELRNLKEIPCNVCDKETALTNIERKHINSGSWGAIERDYFLHHHRGYKKSLFLKFDEQTGIISKHPKMNQRFIKEEVLTEQNLKKIGIGFDPKAGFITNYSEKEKEDVLNKVITLIENGDINTRSNRKELKKPLLDKYPKIADQIKSYDSKKESHILELKTDSNLAKKTRKTLITKGNDIIFGKNLSLKKGKVNDLYRAISTIYEQNNNNENRLKIVLPVIGMSLRLILDIAAREYYKNTGDEESKTDAVYKPFLKKIKKELKNQEDINYLSLTDDWLSDKLNLDGILGKYAHGNIKTTKSDILKTSIVVADILEIDFKK